MNIKINFDDTFREFVSFYIFKFDRIVLILPLDQIYLYTRIQQRAAFDWSLDSNLLWIIGSKYVLFI